MNYAHTTALQKIAGHWDLINRRTKNSSHMALITGEPGLGKSSGLKYLHSITPDSAYVLPYSGITQFGLISLILDELNLPQGIFLRHCVSILFEFLAKQDGEFTLIIDECDFLDTKCLEFVRSIHDRFHIIVLMAGHTRFSSRIKKYPQISDRLLPLSIKPATINDAYLLAEFIGGETFIDDDLIESIYKRIGGNLRKLDEEFTRIKQLSEELNGIKITAHTLMEYTAA